MDLAERTGQLPGLVDRSGVPGADVKTKGVRAGTPQLTNSMNTALEEIEELARLRIRGNASPEFIADLKTIQDEAQLATVEQQLQQQLAAQNLLIAQANSGQQALQMRTVIDPDILRRRQDAARAAQSAGGARNP
jgi:hypothetical protein